MNAESLEKLAGKVKLSEVLAVLTATAGATFSALKIIVFYSQP